MRQPLRLFFHAGAAALISHRDRLLRQNHYLEIPLIIRSCTDDYSRSEAKNRHVCVMNLQVFVLSVVTA